MDIKNLINNIFNYYKVKSDLAETTWIFYSSDKIQIKSNLSYEDTKVLIFIISVVTKGNIDDFEKEFINYSTAICIKKIENLNNSSLIFNNEQDLKLDLFEISCLSYSTLFYFKH